jgi:hypothetical protein
MIETDPVSKTLRFVKLKTMEKILIIILVNPSTDVFTHERTLWSKPYISTTELNFVTTARINKLLIVTPYIYFSVYQQIGIFFRMEEIAIFSSKLNIFVRMYKAF